MDTATNSATGIKDWEQRICRTFVPISARDSDDANPFSGGVDSASMGSVILADVCASNAVVERTPRLIRRNDPELFKFGLQVSGESVVEQDDRQAHLRPGDLTIYDTSRPFRISCADDFKMTVAMFPRSLVRLPEQHMAALTAVRLAGDTGLASLIAPLMRGLSAELNATRAVVATHLGDAVVDLVTAAFAQQMQLPPDLDAPGTRRALIAQVSKFVDDHLHDPDLSTKTVAHIHFVSVRLLQKIFVTEGTSVSALIRTRRLERCRRDLADPRKRHLSIAQIGYCWGFPDAAYFSRLFRSTYGVSPREFRKSTQPDLGTPNQMMGLSRVS